MSATSNDGNAHTLRLYSDISGRMFLSSIASFRLDNPFFSPEFITANRDLNATWGAFDDGEHIVLNMTLVNPQAFTEIANFAQDATEYYAFKRVSIFYSSEMNPIYSEISGLQCDDHMAGGDTRCHCANSCRRYESAAQ